MIDEHAYWLRKNFIETLGLSEHAAEWLIGLWDTIQLFDDVADGEDVERSDLDAVIWKSLVAMPCNQFFAANAGALGAALATMILKWQASDHIEKNGQACAFSFAWRAGYYDVVLLAVALSHDTKEAQRLAPIVMSLYAEKFDEYMGEFGNA